MHSVVDAASHRFPVVPLLLLTLVAVLASGAAAQPTVSFASNQFLVVEQSIAAPVGLVLSEPSDVEIVVIVDALESGTASCGADFSCGTRIATFDAGETTAVAYVGIYTDTVVEDPETIPLVILDNEGTYLIGDPGSATLVIVDDDSNLPQAHFEVSDDIPPSDSGHIALTLIPGGSVEIDVVVDDLPPGGATINYASSADGSIHQLTFTDDPRQTIVVPARSIPEGENHAADILTILNTPDAKATSSPSAAVLTLPAADWPFDDHCMICMVAYIWIAMDFRPCDDYLMCGFDCYGTQVAGSRAGEPTRDLASDLEILTRYRDEVLAGSPTGQYYTQLYEDHSMGIVTAILQRPTFIHRISAVWDLWLPAVAAQVDGEGAALVITSEMETALLDILVEFEEVGSVELGQLVADFRTELDLENIAGTTADDLQQAIESNPMPTRSTSLSDLKARFRGRSIDDSSR